MQDIIYDVAVSADGFIAGVDDDISAFPMEGAHVDDYLARLESYGTALMGRRTYEFGYRFGMAPGQNPYPQMRTLVFSKTLALPDDSTVETVRGDHKAMITDLRKSASAPIYLCGGGNFAHWALERGLITRLRLKHAPVLIGTGIRLFGESKRPVATQCTFSKLYENGVLYQEMRILHAR